MYCTVTKNVKHKDNALHLFTMPMVRYAVSIIWFFYELMIFSNKNCKIIIKLSK